jgi:hypothetical protein
MRHTSSKLLDLTSLPELGFWRERFRRRHMRKSRADTENIKVRFYLQLGYSCLTIEGTWVPLEQGEALAQRNNVYEKLRTIFEFQPGNISPPPAPKHTTAKPKVPKKPAVPKFAHSE